MTEQDPELPKFIKDSQGQLHVEYPDGKGHPYTQQVLPREAPKSIERLWPIHSWLVFLLNLSVVISLIVDLWNNEYDSVKHITIMVTVCGSYAALKYINKYITGREYDD